MAACITWSKATLRRLRCQWGMARPVLSFWFWELLHCKSPNPPIRSGKMRVWTPGLSTDKMGARFCKSPKPASSRSPVWMALGTKESWAMKIWCCHKSLNDLNNFSGSAMATMPLFSDASKQLLSDSVGEQSLTALHLCFSCPADHAMQHSTWCELDQWREPRPECHCFLNSILHLHIQCWIQSHTSCPNGSKGDKRCIVSRCSLTLQGTRIERPGGLRGLHCSYTLSWWRITVISFSVVWLYDCVNDCLLSREGSTILSGQGNLQRMSTLQTPQAC